MHKFLLLLLLLLLFSFVHKENCTKGVYFNILILEYVNCYYIYMNKHFITIYYYYYYYYCLWEKITIEVLCA